MPGELVDETGRVVCPRCFRAGTMGARMRGLLGRKSLPEGEGLLIPRTGSIHTFFMAFPIDVVFLDREGRVKSVAPAVPRGRTRAHRGAKSVVELAAGEAARAGIAEGAKLEWRPLPDRVGSGDAARRRRE